jgi:cytoskeleton protein RodZ
MSRKKSRARARVGEKLRKARERHRISLRQVADATKISVSVLQALERDDISYLPGGVVGRGFVRSFATAVHLDPEAIVAEFLAQFPHESVNEGYRNGAGAETTEYEVTPRPNVKIRLHSASPVRVAVIGIVSAALVVFLYFAIATPNAISTWRDLETKRLRVSEADVPVTKSVALPPLTMTAGVSMPSLSALPLATRISDSPSAAAPPAPTSGTAGTAETPASGPLKVTLSARSPSWVIASVDGKKALSRLMESGEVETLEAGRELVVTAGNGDAVSMTINGAAMGSLGRDSTSVTVRVNQVNLENYLRRAASGSLTRAQ